MFINHVHAQTYPDSAYRFNSRIETKIRTSRARSLAATEIWSPLAQQNDRILYGSLRYMGDDMQNFEGNIGIGYRQIAFRQTRMLPEVILGAHSWIDRRHTMNNQTFYQSVIGFEVIGNKYDFRLNTYIPLSGAKGFRTQNFGSDTPYLAGHGVYYDTNGFAVEEAQTGYDIEVGRRLPFLTNYTDSIRIYNGVYRFKGKQTDDIFGARSRLEINITPSFTVGGRAQIDHIRGVQGMAELTLRFPFSSKKPYSSKDLRSRLDESPERDIDIVTNNVLIDSGLMKPVINPESGTSQRILHVDNRYASNGTGTAENPYHSLVSAQSAMQPNDIIYVHYGDGTSHYLDKGFVISQPDTQLIGAGSHLVYENGRIYGQAPDRNVTGNILISAYNAPVIGNTSTDNAFGHGVLINASNVTVSGLRIHESKGDGIHILANGNTVKNTQISHIDSSRNDGSGLGIKAENGGSIDNIHIYKNNFNNNLVNGVNVISQHNGSRISNILFDRNILFRNSINGWNGQFYGGDVNNIEIKNNVFNQNDITGFLVHSRHDAVVNIDLADNRIVGNLYRGLALETRDMAALNFKAYGNTITDTASNVYADSTGLYIDHDSDNPVFNADFGGGPLRSIGQNRIYNNGQYELYLDSRPGDGVISKNGVTIFAQHNYWGNPDGFNAALKTLFDHNPSQLHYSYIDTNNYLFN